MKRAADIVAWGRAQTAPAGTYLANVRAVLSGEWLSWKNVNIAVSAVTAYEREAGRGKRSTTQMTSEHQGSLGERRVYRNLTVRRIIDLESQWGTSHLHVFEDSSGNVFVWKASGHRLDIGATYHVRGTVKEHNDYKGTRQTVLSRCVCDRQEAARPDPRRACSCRACETCAGFGKVQNVDCDTCKGTGKILCPTHGREQADLDIDKAAF